jgi:hypothetical protein
LRRLFVWGNFYRKLLGDRGIASRDVLLGKAAMGLVGNAGERGATDGARSHARRACGNLPAAQSWQHRNFPPKSGCFRFAVMPLVRIDLRQGKTPEYRSKIGDMVYRAMRETINIEARLEDGRV